MIAALTFAGLIVGLVSDGVGDALGWTGLLVPSLIGMRLLVRPKRGAGKHSGDAR